MVTNLVENAIKYTARVGTQVSVEVGCQDEGKQAWGWVRISDDGPGIAAQHLPHLFERFYTVHPQYPHELLDQQTSTRLSEQPSGNGLGLAIAEWVAKAHQGSIHVQSKVGQGSVFEIRLPRISQACQPEQDIGLSPDYKIST